MKTTIVVSAVNLRKGGTLAILRQCLSSLSEQAVAGRIRAVALVHNRSLVDLPGIEYIEIPWSAKGWCRRLWCEYVTMRKISKTLQPVDLWLSLHDTTPRVVAKRQAVYCHNSYPFLDWKWRELGMNYKIVCFALFTKYFYRYNIRSNYRVITQQQWLKDEFLRMFPLKSDEIIVFPPTSGESLKIADLRGQDGMTTFFYPAIADAHKNFETACAAARLLEASVGKGKFRLVITVKGDENAYARWLKKHWGDVDSIRFAGYMNKEQML